MKFLYWKVFVMFCLMLVIIVIFLDFSLHHPEISQPPPKPGL